MLCSLAAFVCWLIILIDAFKNEIWKGVVGLLCGLYLLYYGFVEFQHEKKSQILMAWIGFGLLGGLLQFMGRAATAFK